MTLNYPLGKGSVNTEPIRRRLLTNFVFFIPYILRAWSVSTLDPKCH